MKLGSCREIWCAVVHLPRKGDRALVGGEVRHGTRGGELSVTMVSDSGDCSHVMRLIVMRRERLYTTGRYVMLR